MAEIIHLCRGMGNRNIFSQKESRMIEYTLTPIIYTYSDHGSDNLHIVRAVDVQSGTEICLSVPSFQTGIALVEAQRFLSVHHPHAIILDVTDVTFGDGPMPIGLPA